MREEKKDEVIPEENVLVQNLDVEHVQTPFPALPSFIIAALILSYWKYSDDVETNLEMLSKKVGKY